MQKKIQFFSALDRDDLLGPPGGTKIQRDRKYGVQPGGVVKNTFFQNMLLPMDIEPTYSKIKFWGPAHTPMSNFPKSRKNGAISRKKKEIFYFFSCHERQKNVAKNFKISEHYFLFIKHSPKIRNYSYDPFSLKPSLLVHNFGTF